MANLHVSVSNDLIKDQRANRICKTLQQNGYNVQLTGRKKKYSKRLTSRSYNTKRLNLLFNKKFLFYAEFNIRLFLYLLFKPSNTILFAIDLDTLPANYLISVIKGNKLIYDSHEYFTEVPELQGRQLVKRIWEKIESFILPKLNIMITVNDVLASIFEKKHNINVVTIKNVPLTNKGNENSKHYELNLENNDKVILYQGAINKDRGLEEAIKSMKELEGYKLVITGDGDINKDIKKVVDSNKVNHKVIFTGEIPFETLSSITSQADIGLSVEKMTNMNYKYSLPNKVFDYIHAGVPVIATSRPTLKELFNKYNIGIMIDEATPENISDNIKKLINNKEKYPNELKKAAKEYCWENESKKLLSTIKNLN